MGLEVVEALTPCTKQPQKQDVRFRQTTAAMLEVLTYTPSIAEQYKTIDMWRRTGRGGTHVAVFGATGAGVMISFSFATLRTLAITAPTERLCDKNE